MTASIAVIAPAGYGKSVFAQQFLNARTSSDEPAYYAVPSDESSPLPYVSASTLLVVDEVHRWPGVVDSLSRHGGVSILLAQCEADLNALALFDVFRLRAWKSLAEPAWVL